LLGASISPFDPYRKSPLKSWPTRFSRLRCRSCLLPHHVGYGILCGPQTSIMSGTEFSAATNVKIADMFRMTAVWHVSKTSVLESIDSELCSNIWHSLILYPSNLTDLSRVDVRAQRDFSANFGRNHSNSTRLE